VRLHLPGVLMTMCPNWAALDLVTARRREHLRLQAMSALLSCHMHCARLQAYSIRAKANWDIFPSHSF
jgi:hypothetical protein